MAQGESFATRVARWGFNLFPAYCATGGRITFIRHDWSEVRLRIGLSWRTRNYVGTIFGGSMYAAVDPVYMLMLIKMLGPDYVVWDKAANIRFRKPGRTTLYATCSIASSVVAEIRTELRQKPKLDRIFIIDLVDVDGSVHATVEKTIYISLRRRDD